MGVALNDQGKLEEAIEAYNKALAIKPDKAAYFVNLNQLRIQLSEPTPTVLEVNKDGNSTFYHILSQLPKYKIQQAISNFMLGELSLSGKCLQKYRALMQTKAFEKLTQKNKVFCNAYFYFLSSLIERTTTFDHAEHKKIYHIGESHCLSYAHSQIYIGTRSFVVTPKITFGAKAFHFSTKSPNKFKAITKNQLRKIPNGSNVFLSIGEIDCRPNEGIIQAAEKAGKTLPEITDKTVGGFTDWFLDKNIINQHTYYFFNVPAPVYNQNYSENINDKVAKVVALFNASLLNRTSS